MPEFVHKTTLALSFSAPVPPGDPADFVQLTRPEYFAAAAIEQHYRKLVAGAVVEMDAGEKAVVDAAEAAALVAENRVVATAAPDDDDGHAVHVRAIIELLNKRDNYLVNRLGELQDALDAMKASSGPADNIRDAIPAAWLATTTRTRADAIADYKAHIAAGGAD